MSSDTVCCICYDSFDRMNPERFPLPCACKGSMRIHVVCIENMMSVNSICPTCKQPWNLIAADTPVAPAPPVFENIKTHIRAYTQPPPPTPPPVLQEPVPTNNAVKKSLLSSFIAELQLTLQYANIRVV